MPPDRTGEGLVRVVWGTGTGPTALAAYDAALVDAGVSEYNLATVSSIVPAGAAVEPVGTAPNLGPAGNRLTVVRSRATVEGPGRATAGIGWTTGDGPGVIYEAAGALGEAAARERIREGLAAARDLRGWTFEEEDVRVTTATNDGDGFCAAAALAAYGRSEPVF